MTNVVKVDFRQVDDRHTCGPHICELCGHREPVVVAPCGRKHFECSKCGRMASVRESIVLPIDGVIRQSCSTCGDQAFAVMADGIMCVSCGTIQKEDWSRVG